MGRAHRQVQPASVSDAFSGLLGTRRGAARVQDDTPEHDTWREVLLTVNGPIVSFHENERHPSVKVRPVCETNMWMGHRSHSAHSGYTHCMSGKLCLDMETREWIAVITSGAMDSQYQSV